MKLYKELLDGIYKYNISQSLWLSKSNNTLKDFLKQFNNINQEINLAINDIKKKME